MSGKGDVVLVTGGSGFLGQHIIKLLQEKDDDVSEIRIIDVQPYKNNLGHAENKPMKSYVVDICDREQMEEYFVGVDVVFHCAALVDFQFPPNMNDLERINVFGTRNVIVSCLKGNVSRLIYTSSASVALRSYLGKAPFSVVVNQSERDKCLESNKSDSDLIIPGYGVTKLRGERIVLGANRTNLANGLGELITCSIRPTVTYGEEDPYFFPSIAKVTSGTGGLIPKILGAGGKHQITYVGNVAWGHICAKRTLKESPNSIAGLPVFITDDTPIEDTSRFCNRLSRRTDVFNIRPSSWSIPMVIGYLFAFLLELVVYVLNALFGVKLSFQPRALSSYSGSLLQYSRLRADLHMNYEPIYNEEESLVKSVAWYENWYQKQFKSPAAKKQN